VTGFDRTYEELKPALLELVADGRRKSFDRTYEELKLLPGFPTDELWLIVLIVPTRN